MRSIANLVGLLQDKYDLFIVTRDRDYQDKAPYPGIVTDEWMPGEGCQLMYLSPGNVNLLHLNWLINQTNADYIYANSLLGYMTRLLLVLNIIRRQILIIAPRGEMHKGALRLKAYKKIPFVYLVKAISKKWIIWHATDLTEIQAIKQFFADSRVQYVPVRFAPDTPKQLTQRTTHIKQEGVAKLVFISRITPKKGLHLLLKLLTKFTPSGQLTVDIYGPNETNSYWQDCLAMIQKLGPTCVVTYQGMIDHDSVSNVLAAYDFFVLPTLGENFGHAIFEAFSVGLPVLISDQTQWRGLQERGAGWDLPLQHEADWLATLQQCVAMNTRTYSRMTVAARHVAEAYMDTVQFEQSYTDLFSTH